MRWLRRLWGRVVGWLGHADCEECEAILKLLQEHRVLLGREMVAKWPSMLDASTIYIHLARLEDRGLVERCWPMRIGPGRAHRRYFYRLRNIA